MASATAKLRHSRAHAAKLRRLAISLYRSTPEKLVSEARYRIGPRRRNVPLPITVEFLRSPEYAEIMNRHVPYDGDYGLHEAQTATKSFMYRAFKMEARLRAYCWRGVQEHLDLILEHFASSPGPVVDLGGAAAPFGLGSVVVDRLKQDIDGNDVLYASLDELPERPGVVITSHTLEHIPELEDVLEQVATILLPGGMLIAFVPAFSCERWRVGAHSHAAFGDHAWTFGLRDTPNLPAGLLRYVEIDALLERWFDLELARYCGDDSIVLVGRPHASAGTS